MTPKQTNFACKGTFSERASLPPVYTQWELSPSPLFLYTMLNDHFILTFGAKMKMGDVDMRRYWVWYRIWPWDVLNGHNRVRLWYQVNVMICEWRRYYIQRVWEIISSTSTLVFYCLRWCGICNNTVLFSSKAVVICPSNVDFVDFAFNFMGFGLLEGYTLPFTNNKKAWIATKAE